MQDKLDANVIYGDVTARMDTIGTFSATEIQVWQAVRRANTDWKKNVRWTKHPNDSVLNSVEFTKWLAETWGIQLYFKDSSWMTEFDIIDDSAYTMFLLKYNK